MFDFLNKLSHDHSPPAGSSETAFQQLSSEEEERNMQRSLSQNEFTVKQQPPPKLPSPRKFQTIQPAPSERKPLKRGDSITGKMQIVRRVELHPAVTSFLEGELARSRQPLTSIMVQKLGKAQVDRERKVYIRQMARDQQEYLHEAEKASQMHSTYLKEGLHTALNGIVDQITKEIEISDLPIRFKRKVIKQFTQRFQDAEQERKQETLRLIKLRENQLQGKIGQLSVEFNLDEEAERRAQEILGKDEFQPDTIKTKMAEEFVKEKQRQRQEHKARLEEERQRRRAAEEAAREEQRKRQEQLRAQKHERLAREFAQKQRARQEQVEKARTEELNYRQFLKEYKQLKPLYQQKEEEFQSRLKEEKKERYHVLKQKQSKYQPLNMEMLQMHQEHYQELRRQDRERKEAELELARQKQRLLKKQLDEKIYKGKFRYIVLQEMVDVQTKKRQKQAERQAILAKKQAYSLQVKQHFKPTIDPSKRNEMEQIVNSHRQRKRKFMTPNRVAYSDHYSTISSNQNHPYSQPEADPKKEGDKYHRLFKQYIRRKIQKGEVKSDNQEPPEEQPTRPPDYLKELREKYQGRLPSKSTRLDREIEKIREGGEDYRTLILKASEFQQKAKQREVKLRNVAHAPGEEAALEQEYLCAIKAKMQLINNMD